MTEDISSTLEVNGADIEASASDRAKPASAYFNAPQSLAPSPTIPTVLLDFYSKSISRVLWLGFIRANIIDLNNISFSLGGTPFFLLNHIEPY